MKVKYAMAMVFTFAISFCWGQYNSFKKLALEMESKTAKGGYSSLTGAEVFYTNDGSMISYYSSPKKYTVMNNAKGEIKIYDPEKNVVLLQQNYLYSTETSQFYYFLNNKKSDLGLKQMGFVQNNVRFENEFMVTEWLPPAQMAKSVGKVELVHENGQPIYIAYYDNNNLLTTKSFYYNYVKLSPILDFPSTITQISYNTPTDSTITKTTYKNIRLDNEVDDKALNFKIPENAKSIE